MVNNLAGRGCGFQQTNVIYEYSCPKEDCKLLNNEKYIGETSTSLVGD
jgi:hypothetical protein